MRDLSTYPHSLRIAAAADDLARDLYVNLQHFTNQPVLDWLTEVPFAERQAYLEISIRTLRELADAKTHNELGRALWDYANVLAKAEFQPGRQIATGLRRDDSNIIGQIKPGEGGAA